MMTVVYLVGALTAPFPTEAHLLVPKAIRYHGPVGDGTEWCVEKAVDVTGYVQIKRLGNRLEILTTENIHPCAVS
jgi:hypothetical protein